MSTNIIATLLTHAAFLTLKNHSSSPTDFMQNDVSSSECSSVASQGDSIPFLSSTEVAGQLTNNASDDEKQENLESSSSAFLRNANNYLFEQESSSGKASGARKPLPQEVKRMRTLINNCYFEAGVLSPADLYFDKLVETHGSFDAALAVLSDIVNHASDDHTMEGILHILSNHSYEEVDPVGITVILACRTNPSHVIEELVISCFEVWNNPDGIDILEKLPLSEPWLIQYRDHVVRQLQNEREIG